MAKTWEFEQRDCNVEPEGERCFVGYVIDSETGHEIAVIYGDESRAERGTLIAAAPELLSALKGCRDMLLAMAEQAEVGFECLGPTHDAIAKAEGSIVMASPAPRRTRKAGRA